MTRRIELGGREVVYRFRRYPRQKNLRLTVHHDATVLVTAPKWVRIRDVEAFVREQASWVIERIDAFAREGNASLFGTREEYLRFKERARALAYHRLRHFNVLYGFTWKRVSIRKQRTMWGSCTEEGNLSFNYKIALLPPPLADYVIVHELCHLGEMNHSKAF
ncbi:MAG: M48 family metallopeptidase, partial [Candidatus Binatia bacterium]